MGAGFGASAGFDSVNEELEGTLPVDCAFSSKSDLTETRSDLYRSSRSATSTKGSDSIAFETAERREMLRPRRAL